MPFHHTVGIDVSKARLDAHRLPDGAAAEFHNTKAGFRKLITWSGEGVECIAYESSGPYHRGLEQTLLQHGLPAARVNPWQARRFAQASGCRAKTDRVDAAMLASMAVAMPLRLTPALSETQRSLQDLQQAREALVARPRRSPQPSRAVRPAAAAQAGQGPPAADRAPDQGA